MAKQFKWAEDYQSLLLACLVARGGEFDWIVPELRSNYFVGVHATITARCLLEYRKERSLFPSWVTLRELVRRETEKLQDDSAESADEFIGALQVMETRDWEHVRDDAVAFLRERAYVVALQKAVKHINDDDMPDGGLAPLFEEAGRVGQNLDDMGFLFHADVDRVVDMVTAQSYGVATGYPLFDKIWKNGWGPGWLIVPLAPPKRYKCQHPDTLILMYDGSSKRICEVKVGDQIMGDDSKPRTVLSCGAGFGPMYRVKQANGDNYEVNGDHILCLKRLAHTVPASGRFKDRYHPDQILEIPAQDYARKPAWFKRTWKGFKVGVEFPSNEVPVDPYFLGLWLGDGRTVGPSISVGDGDPEIIAFLAAFADQERLKITYYRDKKKKTRCTQIGLTHRPKVKNHLTEKMRNLGVIGNKHIPTAYSRNDQTTRLNLLAGLLDSDGGLIKNRGFVFTNTNEKLSNETCWLARSLGFKSFTRRVKTKCTVRGKIVRSTCLRTYVQGKISEIPVKVARKRGRDSAKASDRTTISVRPVGDGEWFGIEIDGNRRYLHGDFTVTHNTGMCINLACNMVSPQIAGDVLYYACELSQELAMTRAMCNIANLSTDYMFETPEKFRQSVKAKMQEAVAGNLLFKSFASKAASILDIRAHAKAAVKQYNLNLKAIYIDYAETVKGDESKDAPEYRKSASVYTGARALGSEMGCCVVMPDRCNKETTDKPVPSMTSFQGSFEKAGIVDVAFGLCATDAEYRSNVIRWFNFLNRHGAAYQHLRGRVDPVSWRMEFNEDVPYDEEAESEERRPRRSGGQQRGVPRELIDP